ncbi:MAG: ribosome maturation factor RimP [Clostridiales bacterium]|nr:ribosome maturation factor RimP [Clostridiales bacterium]
MAKNVGIAETVSEFIKPVVENLGYILWDIKFVKEGAGYCLRVTIDGKDGVGIADCEKVSRTIDPILDEKDPIEQSYSLEVETPGIERELSKKWHYEKCIGETIDVKLFTQDETGSKSHTGVLKAIDDERVTITENEKEISISLKQIAKSNVHFDFTDI